MNKGIGLIFLKKLVESIPSNSEIIVSPGGYLTDKDKQFKFYLKNGFSKTDDENILIYIIIIICLSLKK